MNHPAPRFFRGVAVSGAALAALVALHATGAAAEAPVAIFAGDGLEVVFEHAQAEGRELRGRLHHLGESYPFSATTREDFGGSAGMFRVGENQFAFELVPTGDVNTLRLVTGVPELQSQMVYDLRRRAVEPVPVDVTSLAHAEPNLTPAGPGPVGLMLRGVSDHGWEVTAVDPGSRAERAGFAPGDVITAARAGGGAGDRADMPLHDEAAVVGALTTPGIYLTTARAGRADHTVVLYPAIPVSTSTSTSTSRSDVVEHAATQGAAASASHVSTPAPAPTALTPAARAATALLILEPATATDAVTGLVSHTLLLPQDWSLDAQVLWTPAVDAAFVNLSARATSPSGGQQVTWLPDGAFTDAADGDAAFGDIVDGKVHFPRMGAAADFIHNAVLPGFRPEATAVQVLSDDVLPGLSDAWERHHETFLTAQKKHLSAVHARGAGAVDASRTTARVTAPQVRVRYQEDGAAYEEAFTFVHLELTTPTEGGPVHDWFVFAVSALRAPAGELDGATPWLRAVAESLRPTQRWQAVIEALTPELTRAQPPLTSAQVAERAAPLLKDLEGEVAAHARGWSALGAANAARVEAFGLAIPNLVVTHTPDHAMRHLLPLGNGLRAMINAEGRVILTQDPPETDAARPGGPWQALD